MANIEESNKKQANENVQNLSSDESERGDKRKQLKEPLEPQKKGKKTKKADGNTGRKRSVVWKHFSKPYDIETGNDKANCNYCDNPMACHPRRDGTSAMKRHLDTCEKNPNKLKGQNQLFVKKNGDGDATGEVRNWKLSQENGRRAIAEMVIIEELPFSTVEHEGFKRLMETVCPNLKLPSRFTVSRDVVNIFLEEKAKLKEFFAKTITRVCLTTDTWTSIQQINYMCVTAHFIDENWVYHKRVINFKPISSHKGDDIGRNLFQCLKEWDIEHVLSITVDNATSNDTAISFLKDKINNLLFEGRFLQVRCMCHIINLIVKDGLSDRKVSIERIRKAIKYVRLSPQRLDTFKNCVKSTKTETKALLSLDVQTRWNSTYEMLERACKFEKAFEAYDLEDPNFKNELGSDIPKHTGWYYARHFSTLLELFQRKTTRASASSQVVANQFFGDIMDIDKHLRTMKASVDSEVRLMGMRMLDTFEKYWRSDSRVNSLLYFTAILDPRMKSSVIEFGFTRIYNAEKKEDETDKDIEQKIEATVNRITEELGRVFRIYELDNETESVKNNPKGDRIVENVSQGNDDFFAEFKSIGASSSKLAKTELQRYLDEKEEDHYKGFDILQWWKAASSKYPILAKLAKDLLAIPVSSVASESAFSTGGRVVETFRSSLSPPIVEALICSQDWIRKSRKKINEDLTDFDDIGKEIADRLKPEDA